MFDEIESLVFSLPISKIIEIDNKVLRNTLLQKYEQEKQILLNTYPKYQDFFDETKSLEFNYSLFNQMKLELTSEYLFPGDLINYYPIIQTGTASKDYLCAITGSIIKNKSSYEQFKAFLYNLNKKTSYVSKTIRYEIGSFNPPNTLHEFENFIYKVTNAYQYNFEEYYNISTNIGDNFLRKLSK